MARYDFDPWGRRSLVAGTDVATVGFTRHEWQGWGDLWVTRYRAYDPQLARWLSEDPIGLRGGLNYYGYVQNNPVRFVDPDGREVAILIGGVILAEGAALVLGCTVSTLIALAIGEAISNWVLNEDAEENSDDFPDPENPPTDWEQKDPTRWYDPKDQRWWHWHDDPKHGPPHWDTGGPAGEQEVWPRGGQRQPKVPNWWKK